MIINGDALEVLKRLADNSVQCFITSPPFYGLRKYGTPPILWGGDIACPHEWKTVHPPGHRASDTKPGKLQHDGNKNREQLTSELCTKCGAWRGELGLEPTPDMYVEHLTTICREVRRVLREDGLFWLNIGDCRWKGKAHGDLKPKDLIEIPSDVAKALRKDGWYLRARLPWIKRNSFPESVTDRPAAALEYVFILAKSGDTLFWTHPELPGVRTRPEPDYLYTNALTGESTRTPPEDWMLLFYEKTGKQHAVWKRQNQWRGNDYFYDRVAVLQKSSESYNRDKRPRGELRQRVNKNSKYPDEGQFKKQDNTGNPQYTGFNERYAKKMAEAGVIPTRNFRDSDFIFKTWQGLLQNEDGEPVALVVNPRSYKGAHFACVDTETECLTVSGWKRYDQLRDGMPIFTYNMEKGCLKLQPLETVLMYRYSGNLVSVFGRSSNMLMTPNHRCVVTTRDKKVKGGRHPAKIIEAKDLKGGMKFIVSSHLDFAPVVPNEPKEFYELIGWFLSEGHYSEGGGIEISQSLTKNPQHCKRIQELLIELNVEHSTSTRTRTRRDIRNGGDFTWKEQEWAINGEVRKKIHHMIPDKQRIPEHFLMLPDEYAFSFLSGFVGGDGHIRPDGRVAITQKEKQPLDIIQGMFIRLGYSCILSQKGRGMWSAFITSAHDRCFKNYTSSLIKHDYVYDGIVWCPTVKNGTWVARRGGRSFITGNSFPPQLVEPMILASTSERGCCPHCGAPWVRIVDRDPYTYRPTTGSGNQKTDQDPDIAHGIAGTGGHVAVDFTTLRWEPSCKCDNNVPEPCLVCDPFGGSGATGVCAKELGRASIIIELKEEYCGLAEERIKNGK